jgi:antitoxin component of RelBE/YafQ-DinJ toxin-antitoxin module
MYDKVMNCRIDQDLRAKVKSVAKEHNITESDMIRRGLLWLIGQYNQKEREEEMLRAFEAY